MMEHPKVSGFKKIAHPLLAAMLMLTFCITILVYSIKENPAAFEAAQWLAITAIPVLKDFLHYRERRNGN